jgi:hypothetical protein
MGGSTNPHTAMQALMGAQKVLFLAPQRFPTPYMCFFNSSTPARRGLLDAHRTRASRIRTPVSASQKDIGDSIKLMGRSENHPRASWALSLFGISIHTRSLFAALHCGAVHVLFALLTPCKLLQCLLPSLSCQLRQVSGSRLPRITNCDQAEEYGAVPFR